MTKKMAIGMAALLAFAASCSSSSGSSGGACMLTPTSNGTVTMVTAASANTSSCPTITPAQLNAPSDGGNSGCSPQVNTSNCTATYNCAFASGSTIMGTETATGGSFTASVMVSIAEDAGALSCSYTLSGTVP